MARHLVREIYSELNHLVLFRSIAEDCLVRKASNLMKLYLDGNGGLDALYYEICHDLISIAWEEGLSGDLWKEYLLRLIILDENAFSLTCERSADGISRSLSEAALHDLNILKKWYLMDWGRLRKGTGSNTADFITDFQMDSGRTGREDGRYRAVRRAFTEDKPVEEILKVLQDYYQGTGCGEMGLYRAFRWEEGRGLVPVKHPDPVTFDDLIGYEKQKETLVDNTEAFINGAPANNLLLFGDRGTGKSSSVKALVNKYFARGLRLIELPKHQLVYFPDILAAIRSRGLRFIIFIDDLSFEDFETEYKYLKAVIEGSVEARPDNVLIYATSNRRHLIKESWKDREGDDVHVADSLQEKLSLVDRFGVTITFTSPDQEEYLEIVRGLARKHNIEMPEDELTEQALQWVMWHNGRSGRTAQQFINYLLGNSHRGRF